METPHQFLSCAQGLVWSRGSSQIQLGAIHAARTKQATPLKSKLTTFTLT